MAYAVLIWFVRMSDPIKTHEPLDWGTRYRTTGLVLAWFQILKQKFSFKKNVFQKMFVLCVTIILIFFS